MKINPKDYLGKQFFITATKYKCREKLMLVKNF